MTTIDNVDLDKVTGGFDRNAARRKGGAWGTVGAKDGAMAFAIAGAPDGVLGVLGGAIVGTVIGSGVGYGLGYAKSAWDQLRGR